MIGAPASKSFTAPRALPQRNRISPVAWMNLVCLDAPLVAVSWQWLFAKSSGLAVAPGARAALFLTAWLIYLADRFGDSMSVDLRRSSSLRQRFCVRHQRGWLATIGIVGAADLVVVATLLEPPVLWLGSAVGAAAVVYLIVNQRKPAVWRLVPAKEITIGVLFAAGTIVGFAPLPGPGATTPWLLFAALCALNCISIAVWERWLDEAQQRVSIATVFPRVAGVLPVALALLIALSFAAARYQPGARELYVPLGVSATLLAIVHFARRRIQPDVRTALADLVLLTPLPLLLVR